MRKVLVVDDAAFQRLRTARVLQEAGFEVTEAQNGEEAVARYAAERPDVVLMDITMPVMDGVAATAAITEQDPAARVVMVSALGQQSMVMAAMKAGARDFLVKPVQPQQILEVLQRLA